MELKIAIEIVPPAKELTALEMDTLMNGELAEFEKWFIRRQREKGLEAAGLIGAERGVVKAYILYAATARSGAV